MPLVESARTVNEKTSFQYTATLKDEAGIVIAATDLTTLTVTLYDVASGDIINTQTDTDIKNANNGTVHATSGLLTWVAKPADNPIVGTSIDVGATEEHIALFEWTYNSGNDAGKHELHINVKQLTKVT